MDDFDRLSRDVEKRGKIWSQKDIDRYFKISEEEPTSKVLGSEIYGKNKLDSIVFFEGETVRIAYENGIVTPKDFKAYERELKGLIKYIDKVARHPLESNPSAGLWEIAGLKDVMIFAIEDIDAYFLGGGKFHEKELRKIQSHLDGRLYMLRGPITKLGNLLGKVNTIK